ncbi:alpha/beta hydrolase [bacterium NHP-B]|nr:alpha/beta hydrolase [bacterium NHP-B]
MREKSFLGLNPQGFHRVVYQEWGEPDNPQVVVCVHGLTRNSGDFFWLAEALSKHFRVICPDMVGRGRSDYLRDAARYTYPQYMADLNVLLGRLDVERVHWVGTSMGGLIGMMMASLPQNPIKKMVLNDIGPFIPKEGLQRLMKYVPKNHAFEQFDEVIQFLKSNLLGYKDVTPLQWKQMAEQSVLWDVVNKTWNTNYDPLIASTISTKDVVDIDFWQYWEKLSCPVLALHGANSDILRQDTVNQMACKPGVKTHSFPKQGHALSLATSDQINLVTEFLLSA